MVESTLLNEIEWAQHPMDECAGQPIIPASNFASLAFSAGQFTEVVLTEEEILLWLANESMRFSACGANYSGKFGVLRKNPKSGWQYVIDGFTKQEKPE